MRTRPLVVFISFRAMLSKSQRAISAIRVLITAVDVPFFGRLNLRHAFGRSSECAAQILGRVPVRPPIVGSSSSGQDVRAVANRQYVNKKTVIITKPACWLVHAATKKDIFY